MITFTTTVDTASLDVITDDWLDGLEVGLRAACDYYAQQVVVASGWSGETSGFTADSLPIDSITKQGNAMTATVVNTNWKFELTDTGQAPYGFDLGAAWHPGSKRSNKTMIFPYQGVGASYSAKADGGSGERMGPIRATSRINSRGIRERNICDKVAEEKEDEMIAKILEHFAT